MQQSYTPAVTLGTTLAAVTAARNTVVDYLACANNHTADIAVTVQDGNGKTWLPAVVMPAGQLTVIPIPEGGLTFFGGLLASAATAGKVDCWIRMVA
jgi:hypothetical protein